MRQKKKNKFYTFILSFVPGAAEMYMGFMKNGFSIMLIFCISLFGILTIAETIFLYTSILLWFYSFFHARNYAACEIEEFENIQDDFIWTSILKEKEFEISNPMFRKGVAGGLIVFGSVLLWQNFAELLYRLIPEQWWSILAPMVSSVPEVVIALLIIYIGMRLIRGKKEELDGDDK